MGNVQTVLGIIDAEDLGITLPHEHLLVDLSVCFEEPTEVSKRALAYQPVRFENLGWIKANKLNNLDDLQITDEEMIIREANLFKRAGGRTIVELSNNGLRRDPLGLARIARETGLNIIMGAGFYIGAAHPKDLAMKTEQQIAEEIKLDIMVGVGQTGIRAGIIGEIGCSQPLENSEVKVLKASAIAQRDTGVAINVHPSPDEKVVLDIIGILKDSGADLSRTAISHVCGWGYSIPTLKKIADAGCYIEYDLFGHEGFITQSGVVFDMPSDMYRIRDIMRLINDGYIEHILISSDHCYKHSLVSYGGYGYAHILENVVRMMRLKGMTSEQVDILIKHNPKRLLQIKT